MSKRSPERCSRKCCGSPRPGAARSVQSVRVCVGHFSGVEELLLASAFELATIDTIAASAQLEVESVPLALHCQECDHHFQPAALRFQCAGVRLCTGPHHGRRGARSGKREPYDCRRRRRRCCRPSLTIAPALPTAASLATSHYDVCESKNGRGSSRFARRRAAGREAFRAIAPAQDAGRESDLLAGAGKTSLLEATARLLAGRRRLAVLVGDIATDRDAQRSPRWCPLSSSPPAVRVISSSPWSSRGLRQLGPVDADILFIENVGNLVCPASHDLGEHLA